MNFLLDTNIIIFMLRSPDGIALLERDYPFFSPENNAIISVITIGEIKSLAIRNRWGTKKLNTLDQILQKLIIADINIQPLIDKYAEIENFSQGTLPGKPLGMSPRNMGKNDLWIAATAAVSESILLTSDNDFDHLDGHFLTLSKVTWKRT